MRLLGTVNKGKIEVILCNFCTKMNLYFEGIVHLFQKI